MASARVDFEDDLPPLDGEAVAAELQAVRTALLELVADGERGQLLREGLKVAIVGRPLSLIHISEPTRQEAISYAVFCLKKKI